MKGPIGKPVELPDALNELSRRIIGCAMAVHRELGYGLLERIYEDALAYELTSSGLAVQRQTPIIVRYRDIEIAGQRIDLLVEGLIVIEVKAVEAVADAHLAQLVSYIRAGRYPLGLLVNFHTLRLKDSIYRRVNSDALEPRTQHLDSAPSALPLRSLRSNS
ncbi:MAG: GxxExxY protein [Phycisphaerales bacterium JB039]